MAELTREEFISFAKRRIEDRARSAGMDFDPADILVADDAGATTAMLRRVKVPTYDDGGERCGWEYKDLAWIEVWRPECRMDIDSETFRVKLQHQLILLCPWLVFLRLPDGTVKGYELQSGMVAFDG